MKIVADKNIPFLRGIAEHFGEVQYLSGKEFTKEIVQEADTLLVRTVTHFGKDILDGSKVKLICSATIGFDHIDTRYCDEHGIAWRNAPGCNSGSVQQYIASALICIARQRGFSLSEKTIGIVGVGNVGKKVAQIAEILGMRVLKNDPPREESEGSGEFCSLTEIQEQADFITFHTPLIQEGRFKTQHLADETFFRNLKKKPVIINSARGAIIDTTAIKQAIRQQQISDTVIDCWENEPDIDREYLALTTISTPHIAGYSADGKANATRMALTSLADFWHLDKAPIAQISIPEITDSVIEYEQASDFLENCILRIYDIQDDHNRLRQAPENFSGLRSNYPLRREFGAYQLVGDLKSQEILKNLRALGFRIK